jgi:hypothetical protein
VRRITRKAFAEYLAQQKRKRFARVNCSECPLAMFIGGRVGRVLYGPSHDPTYRRKLPKWAQIFVSRWDCGDYDVPRTGAGALKVLETIP